MTRRQSQTEFSSLVQKYFLERLVNQKGASHQTIAAYRDTFKLFFKYVKKETNKDPTDITVDDFNSDLVLGFLNYLEVDRANCVRSRNARLATLRSFAKYLALQCPHALSDAHQILSIPNKRFEKPLIEFLTREEVQAILATPNQDNWFGLRDQVLLLLLYNTGARVSELIGIRVGDLVLVGSPYVRLRGKGRKQRTIPLWKETVAKIRLWLKYNAMSPNQPLLPNRQGRSMTRTNVGKRIEIAVKLAAEKQPQLRKRVVSAHTFRHSTAMHLLQSGVDITVIALWLGHESTSITHDYLEADLAMKERALKTIDPPESRKLRFQPADPLLLFLERL